MSKWLAVGAIVLTVATLIGCSVSAPINAGELGEQGLELEREGRYDEAIEKYTKAIELLPESLGFRLMRATAYMSKEDYDSAIMDYTKIIELFPEVYGDEGYFERGRAYKANGDYEHAIADFEKAISISSDSEFINHVRKELEKLRQ